jgi:hypothetical protein
MNMDHNIQRLLLLLGLVLPACDLPDKDIGESGDGDGDSTGDSTGDGDGGECEPPDPSVTFSYVPPDFGLGEFDDANIDTYCTVIAADVLEGIHIELDCPETPNPVIIDVTATPTISVPVVVGGSVQVRYVRIVTAWIDTYLELRTGDGDYLFSIVDALNLFPPYGVDNPFSLGTGISKAFTGCIASSDQCGDRDRIRLGFDNDGPVPEITDGSFLVVEDFPTIDVWLVEAREVEHPDQVEDPQACVDTPTGWYRMLVATGL